MTAKSRLRVLTINIWNRSGPWDDRLPLLRAGVSALDPDIIGLQEVIYFDGRSQADDIGAALGYSSAFGEASSYGGGVLFGNAVLSRWPIQTTRVFPLPHEDTDQRRSLLFAEIASPHGLLPFFVTHLNWKLHEGYAREAQVLAVASHVKAAAPIAGLPPVLVGDFNAAPEATEIRFLRGLHALERKSTYFADCFELAGQGPGYTFDARHNPFAAPTMEPPRRIDYIFVRGPDQSGRGLPLSSKVVFDEVQQGICATDHYGVYAEISI